MENGQFRNKVRSKTTSWKVYTALALLVIAAGAMLFGFNSDIFKPATGSANAMALSADR